MNTLGNYLKAYRVKNDLTTRQLGDYLDVSSSYITQLEHGKRMPSKLKLYEILTYFTVNVGVTDLPIEEIIKDYCNNKKVTFDTVYDEYIVYEKKYKKMKYESLYGENKDGEKLHNAQVRIHKDENKIVIIEEPYFNLAWLLSQDDYEVFFLDEFNTQKEARFEGEIPIMNSIYGAILTKEDKIMIYEILKQVFKHRFKKRNELLYNSKDNNNKGE
ncbi:helix-turn-helix domain-containing protein [Macrococcoides caseolyticum]|uniref:helix-turn-helix domain-containing protein n=1 Tax=Macrococcoides caseolyticum TaxID=69966 RepID=UPI000C33FC29|nr:helix-turn-helix transcriptional regulator [Macrococcus caseolyticus]PKE17383.1 hypothetical protein CW718_04475 [Macrococcus caseolyticus]PKE68322.1 hypothetical protein CW663_03190 [Macrococcus caseolyticus]